MISLSLLQTESRLLGWSDGSSGVDIRADECLAKDGEQTALGLLALSGTGVDEAVDAGGGNWR